MHRSRLYLIPVLAVALALLATTGLWRAAPVVHAATPPVISSISPTSGTSAGGTSVAITGSGFTGATGVNFGPNAATFTVNSDTSITATSPAGTGVVQVTVTTGNGTSGGFTFTYTPVFGSINPTSGPAAGGVSVTITGSGFDPAPGGTTVAFGPNQSSSVTCNVSGTQCTAVTPPAIGLTANPVTVEVSAFGNSSSSPTPAYTYNAPAVTSVSPSTGSPGGGTLVTIKGTNFTGATTVKFGTVVASFTIDANNPDTTLTATAPAAPAGTVVVTVTSDTGTSSATGTAANQFTYQAAASGVTGVNPNSGPNKGGQLVVITGNGFTGAASVKFGSATASFTLNNDSQITAITPATAAVGKVDVTVTLANSTVLGAGDQLYTEVSSIPTVTGINPTQGPTTGNTSVTISGSGLTGATSVTFGANSASFTVDSDTQITAISPAGGAGGVPVTVTNAAGAALNTPTFTYTAVTLTGVNPTSGPAGGGNAVVLTGSGFTGASAVKFGANSASFTVNSDTKITATAPGGAAGAVNVSVTAGGVTSTLNNAYTYIAVTLTGVNPTSGPVGGGNAVVLTGTGFTGATTVAFGANNASFTINSDTQITATAPVSTLAPPTHAGPVQVQVTTPGGTSNQVTYTYVTPPTPTLTGVNPNNGPTTGGNTVTLTGTGFSGGATSVTFGGNTASFTVNSDTQITATVPASTLAAPGTGPVQVQVTTAGGTSNTVTYTYTSIIPAVTSLFPNSGPATGGTSITISGSGFSTTVGATNIYFGTTQVPASDINCTTSSQCSVRTPAGFGMVDVTVIVNGQTSPINAGDQYHFVPVVSVLNPTGGPTGGATVVTITGAGFSTALGGTTISFGANAGTNINCISQTQCTVTSPASTLPGDKSGPVDVRVTVAGQTSAIAQPADQFTYFAIAMTLSGRTTDFTYRTRTITVDVNGNVCATTTQTYTSVFSVGLPTSCGGGAITFFIGATPAGYTTSTGQSCIAFTPGTNYTGMSVGTGLPVNTSCYP